MSVITRSESNNGKIKASSRGGGVKKPTKIGLKLVEKIPFHYGFVVVLVGTLTKAFSAPGQTPTLGSILTYVIDDLGLEKSTASIIYTCATLASSACIPMLGYTIDKLGLRYTGLVNGTLMALSCILFGSYVKTTVFLTMFLYTLRVLGQGGMMLVGTTLISKWWIHKRGLMQGISGVGLSVSMTGIFPILARLSCETLGWRKTFVAIGLALIVFFLPLCFVFFLEQPEHFGLLPDSQRLTKNTSTDDREEPKKQPEVEGKTLSEALRTLDFWAATTACGMWAFNATGAFFHLISIIGNDLKDGGNSDRVISSVYLTSAITSSCFTLLVGYLFDKMNPKYIIGVGLLAQSLAMFIFSVDRNVILTIIAAFVFGASNGCMNNMSGVVHAYLFGRKHLGKISGFGYTSMVVGSALGPLPLGLIKPGSITQQTRVLLVLSALPVLSAIFALCCKMKPLVPRREKGGEATKENIEMEHLLSREREEEEEDSSGRL